MTFILFDFLSTLFFSSFTNITQEGSLSFTKFSFSFVICLLFKFFAAATFFNAISRYILANGGWSRISKWDFFWEGHEINIDRIMSGNTHVSRSSTHSVGRLGNTWQRGEEHIARNALSTAWDLDAKQTPLMFPNPNTSNGAQLGAARGGGLVFFWDYGMGNANGMQMLRDIFTPLARFPDRTSCTSRVLRIITIVWRARAAE